MAHCATAHTKYSITGIVSTAFTTIDLVQIVGIAAITIIANIANYTEVITIVNQTTIISWRRMWLDSDPNTLNSPQLCCRHLNTFPYDTLKWKIIILEKFKIV